MDLAYRNYVCGADFRNCANCSSPIEKSGGCNHMTCTHCNYEFCWICGSKYSRNHYFIFNFSGCPGMQFLDLGEEEIEVEEVSGTINNGSAIRNNGSQQKECQYLKKKIIYPLYIHIYL